MRETMAALGSVRQEVATVRGRKRNEGRQKRYRQRKTPPQANCSSRRICVHWTQSAPSHRSAPRKVAITFDQSSLTGVRRRRCSRPVRKAGGAGSPLRRCGCENWLRIALDCPTRTERAGFREGSQPRPCRAANKDRAETSEDLAPGQ